MCRETDANTQWLQVCVLQMMQLKGTNYVSFTWDKKKKKGL